MEILTLQLSEIAEVTAGQSPPSKYYNETGEGLPFYQGKTDFGETNPTPRVWCTNPARVAEPGDILMSVRAPVGPVNLASEQSCIGRGIGAIRAQKGISQEYLYYYFKLTENRTSSKATGAVFKAISKAELKKLPIRIPKLESDQTHIAALLRHCEQLIRWREESIELLEEYVRSVFLEMFGDPVSNEKKWDVIPMKKAIPNITTGSSYGGQANEKLEDDELGVLKISAVTKGVFDATEFKAVKKEVITREPIFVKEGMLLMSRANTRELVAATALIHEDYPQLFLPDKIWSLEYDSDVVHPRFLNQLFSIEPFRDTIRRKASGGHSSMLNVSQKKFLSLDLIAPPIELQRRYGGIAKSVRSLLVDLHQSLTHLRYLYASYSQRAFRGELDPKKLAKFAAALPSSATLPLHLRPRPEEDAGPTKGIPVKTSPLDVASPSTEKKVSPRIDTASSIQKLLNAYPVKSEYFKDVVKALGFPPGIAYEDLRDRLFARLDIDQPAPLKQVFDAEDHGPGLKIVRK